jgi:hypothetical protein
MKKNVLTLAVAGALTASAQAQMYVDSDNTGEVLIYPFYSADNGNQTYIHVVNTTKYAKAAKVRIMEAENSYEVRDFNLYLSPYDHFSFTIKLDESGAGKLQTADTSCTVPAIPEGGIEFTNKLFEKEANASLERTLNGYVEVIEMGQFANTAKTDPGYLWDHAGKGTPRDCAAVVKLWSEGGAWWKERNDRTDELGVTGALTSWTGGGLYGMGIMVNPEAGAAVGYDAVAIDGFVDAGPAGYGGAALHYYPGNTNPGLQGNAYTSDDATVFNGGSAITYDYAASAPVTATLNAVSGMLMVDTVSNDYVLDEAFAGKTDWVVTFPTKRLYVAADSDTKERVAINPFYEEWDTKDSCDPYRITVYDREENSPKYIPGEPPFSPYTDPEVYDAEICYEANILTFTAAGEDAQSPILGAEPSASGARIQTVVETPYQNGWAQLDFKWTSLAGTTYKSEAHELTASSATPTSALTHLGLPTVGFSVIRFGNNSLSGGTVLANYAAAHEHKTSRAVSN